MRLFLAIFFPFVVFFHNQAPHRRHHLPAPPNHADRLASCGNLGCLCIESVQD
jgi:hypothetical protein